MATVRTGPLHSRIPAGRSIRHTSNGTSPRRGARVLLATVVAAVSVLSAACDDAPEGDGSFAASGRGDVSAAEEAVEVVSEPSLRPGDQIPAPTGKVLLTVTGGTAHNVGNRLELDRTLIDRLGSVRYRTDDAQATGREVTVEGPLVSTLLAVAGSGGATTMHASAANDYTVDIPITEASTYPLMLADLTDGAPMNVAHYGPLRFVYPTDVIPPSTQEPVRDSYWIWQLTDLALR